MLKTLESTCVLEDFASGPDGAVYEGREAIEAYMKKVFGEAKALHIEIEEISGYGSRCIVRWKCTWKTESGEPQALRGADIFKVWNGLICEQLSYSRR